MARAGLTKVLVIEEAERMIDELGTARLTLTALAGRLGVKQPSLYKHIEGLDDLLHSVSVRAKLALADELTRVAVGRAGSDAVIAMSTRYRAWAKEHPGRYLTTNAAPAPDDEDDLAAASAITRTPYAIVHGFGLEGDDAIHATRAWRAVLHGFVTLEAGGAFGLATDIDRSFDLLIDRLVETLAPDKTNAEQFV